MKRATRPRKPEHLGWAQLKEEWAARFGGGLVLDGRAQQAARKARHIAVGRARDGDPWASRAAAASTKAAFTRADLIETLGAAMPDGLSDDPRLLLEELVDKIPR